MALQRSSRRGETGDSPTTTHHHRSSAQIHRESRSNTHESVSPPSKPHPSPVRWKIRGRSERNSSNSGVRGAWQVSDVQGRFPPNLVERLYKFGRVEGAIGASSGPYFRSSSQRPLLQSMASPSQVWKTEEQSQLSSPKGMTPRSYADVVRCGYHSNPSRLSRDAVPHLSEEAMHCLKVRFKNTSHPHLKPSILKVWKKNTEGDSAPPSGFVSGRPETQSACRRRVHFEDAVQAATFCVRDPPSVFLDQLVLHLDRFTSFRSQSGSRPSSMVWKNSHRQRRVFFINSPRVVYFHKDSAPATISCGRPRPFLGFGDSRWQSRTKPCLKFTTVTTQKGCTRLEPREVGIKSLPMDAAAPGIQEESNQFPWQPVRKKFWWRRRNTNTGICRQITERQNTVRFKKIVGDRCFNCLSRGHRKIHCRDPPKCWRCDGSGHISTFCKVRVPTGRPHRTMPTPTRINVDATYQPRERRLPWCNSLSGPHFKPQVQYGNLKGFVPFEHVEATNEQVDCNQTKWVTSDAIHIVPQESFELEQGWTTTKKQVVDQPSVQQHTIRKWHNSDVIVVPLMDYTMSHFNACVKTAEVPSIFQQNKIEAVQTVGYSGSFLDSQGGDDQASGTLSSMQEVANATSTDFRTPEGEATVLAQPSTNRDGSPAANEGITSPCKDVPVTLHQEDYLSSGEDLDFYNLLKLFKQATTQPISTLTLKAPNHMTFLGAVALGDCSKTLPLESGAPIFSVSNGNACEENFSVCEVDAAPNPQALSVANQSLLQPPFGQMIDTSLVTTVQVSDFNQGFQPTITANQVVTEATNSLAGTTNPQEPISTMQQLTDAPEVPLQKLKQAVLKPLPESILSTLVSAQPEKETEATTRGATNRYSPRLSRKEKKQKSAIKLAQELLPKKRGLVEKEKDMVNLALQKFIDTYKKPLKQLAMEAIKTLSEVAEIKKKMKKKQTKNQEAVQKIKKTKKRAPQAVA